MNSFRLYIHLHTLYFPSAYDGLGATLFVVAVIAVYSLSITMLIVSHISKQSKKIMEDKEIKKYLNDFMVRKHLQTINYMTT